MQRRLDRLPNYRFIHRQHMFAHLKNENSPPIQCIKAQRTQKRRKKKTNPENRTEIWLIQQCMRQQDSSIRRKGQANKHKAKPKKREHHKKLKNRRQRLPNRQNASSSSTPACSAAELSVLFSGKMRSLKITWTDATWSPVQRLTASASFVCTSSAFSGMEIP